MLTHRELFAGMIKSARPTRESAPRRIAYLASSRRSIRRAQNIELREIFRAFAGLDLGHKHKFNRGVTCSGLV